MLRKLTLSAVILCAVTFTNAQSNMTSQTISNALQNFSSVESGTVYKGSSIPVFSHKEETRGSRYLSGNWMKGTVISAANEVVQNDSFSYNYDKVRGSIFITTDKNSVIEVDKKEFKAFTFKADTTTYTFERCQAINNDDLFQKLAGAEGKYFLYKEYHTTLKKADYHSDGIMESGNPYDEWVDKPAYYIIFPGGKLAKPVQLKKKSIRDLLSIEDKKLNAYFSAHSSEFINESFLSGLINYINGN